MASPPSTTTPGYVVIRLVPTAAVDGPTFATCLDGLSLQIFAADTPADEPPVPLSDTVFCSPMVVYHADVFGDSVPLYSQDKELTTMPPTPTPTPTPTSPGYVVVRIVPTAAVDGPTFATYLDGLQIQLFSADTPAGAALQPLSDVVYYSPLVAYQFGELDPSQAVFTTVSELTTSATAYGSGSGSSTTYGSTLTFGSTDGISIGSYLFSADPNSPFYNLPTSLQVVAVQETEVTFNSPLTTYALPAGTIASFINNVSGSNPWSLTTPAFSFTLTPSGPATAGDSSTNLGSGALLVIPFASTAGVTVGMAVSSSMGAVAPPERRLPTSMEPIHKSHFQRRCKTNLRRPRPSPSL